jgi:hypothetical protein
MAPRPFFSSFFFFSWFLRHVHVHVHVHVLYHGHGIHPGVRALQGVPERKAAVKLGYEQPSWEAEFCHLPEAQGPAEFLGPPRPDSSGGGGGGGAAAAAAAGGGSAAPPASAAAPAAASAPSGAAEGVAALTAAEGAGLNLPPVYVRGRPISLLLKIEIGEGARRPAAACRPAPPSCAQPARPPPSTGCLNDAPCPPFTSHGASMMLQLRCSWRGWMVIDGAQGSGRR